MIPASDILDQSQMAALLARDPLTMAYRALFSLFDWSLVENWQAKRPARGQHGHPLSAYLKIFLIRINQGLQYTSQLRRFLLEHPLLVIEVGFDLVLDVTAPYGVDCEQTVPTDVWLRKRLRTLDQTLLQELLHGTVQALQAEIPGLGEVVAFDVKHIYAWVQENNQRAYVTDRYDKTRRPTGDPDCKLGVKRSTNQEQPDGSTKEKKEYVWGYGSGVAAATHPVYGDVVLAEYTLPFNHNDVTYYRPLYQQTVVALDHFPTHTTADAAFDSWYVYDDMARHGGIAAVPLNGHGHEPYERTADGVPLCPRNFPMHPTYHFTHSRGYRAQLYRCPLYFPTPQPGACCDHVQFTAAKGCIKHVNLEKGGTMRWELDREGALYKSIYKQRTCCERINSQSKALGIERPKVRNGQSVRNLNTLIYLIINVRALQKVKSINDELQQMN